MPMPTIRQIPLTSREQIRETLAHADEAAKLDPKCDEREVERRYETLVPFRQPYLDEARLVSQAVIPYLYPPEGMEDSPLSSESANQSLIAKGVINMAKSLNSTVFPDDARFFENKVLPSVADEIEAAQQQADPDTAKEVATVQSAVNNRLVARDQTIRSTIIASPDSENLYQAFLHAIVSGTACFFKPNLDTSKIYTLEDFVSEFDSSGDLVEVIVRDVIHPSKFTPKQLKDLFGTDDLEKFEQTHQEGIVVYTRQIRRFDHWEIQVEIAGKRYAPMEGKEDLDAPPFIVFPFFLLPKKKYGVSWITHIKGDVIQFENLSLSVNALSEAAAKIVALIPPDMKVTQAELAGSGMSFIFGSPSPIQMILADVSKNLQALTGVYDKAERNLMSAFLMNESIQRDAERVTAEEWRTMVEGLRNLLGGLFKSLARRVQYPYIRRVDKLMVAAKRIPELPEGTYQLALTAGIETLQAAHDLQAHDQFMARLTPIPGALEGVNVEEYRMRTANQLGVVTDRLILTEEQQMDKMGVKQIVEMARQLGPQGPMMFAQMAQMMMQQAMQAPGGESGGQDPTGGGQSAEPVPVDDSIQ